MSGEQLSQSGEAQQAEASLSTTRHLRRGRLTQLAMETPGVIGAEAKCHASVLLVTAGPDVSNQQAGSLARSIADRLQAEGIDRRVRVNVQRMTTVAGEWAQPTLADAGDSRKRL